MDWANAQVDALVHYPDRKAALEVVADYDAAFNEQWAALERIGQRVDVPALGQCWMVQLQRDASVRRVVNELPALLLDWQDNPPPDRPRWAAPDELDDLKILSAR